jgi:hypothetical protein
MNSNLNIQENDSTPKQEEIELTTSLLDTFQS